LTGIRVACIHHCCADCQQYVESAKVVAVCCNIHLAPGDNRRGEDLSAVGVRLPPPCWGVIKDGGGGVVVGGDSKLSHAHSHPWQPITLPKQIQVSVGYQIQNLYLYLSNP